MQQDKNTTHYVSTSPVFIFSYFANNNNIICKYQYDMKYRDISYHWNQYL